MRIVLLRAAAIAALSIALFADYASGQPSPFNMFQDCPEGCRDVDRITTCGSLVDVASCQMSTNGDVSLVCTNGDGYFLGQFGCSTNASGTDAIDYFFSKTRACVRYVSTEFFQYRQYFAPVMMILAVWIAVAGYRFLSPTLTIFAFVWEFFFALYLLIMAGSDNNMATYVALGLGALVAVLCFWRGPMFGRAVVGVSMGTLVSVFSLTMAGAKLDYVTVAVVVVLDVVGVFFAYMKKRSSIIALFGFSVAVLVFVCIASWGNYSVNANSSAESIAILAIPAFVAGVICVCVNAYWCKKRDEQKRVNRRFQQQTGRGRGRADPDHQMILDVSMTRPGERSPERHSPASSRSRGYGGVHDHV